MAFFIVQSYEYSDPRFSNLSYSFIINYSLHFFFGSTLDIFVNGDFIFWL